MGSQVGKAASTQATCVGFRLRMRDLRVPDPRSAAPEPDARTVSHAKGGPGEGEGGGLAGPALVAGPGAALPLAALVAAGRGVGNPGASMAPWDLDGAGLSGSDTLSALATE